MVLKFLQSSLQDVEREEGLRLLSTDLRVKTLIEWLMARYEYLDIEYKIANTFSIGMLISAFEYELPNDEYYEMMVLSLNNIDIPPQRVADVPSLVFMLPAFITEDTGPLIAQVVEQLSATYFVVMRDRIDLLVCSTLLMGWGRSFCYNEDFLE